MTTLTPCSPTYPPEDLPIVVQDRRRRGFYTVDNEVIDRYGTVLKAHGVAVYTVLARFTNRDGECFPAQSSIAARLGMSRMQVSREIDKLKTLGLIEVKPQFGPHGEQRSNLYILCDVPKAAAPVQHRYTPCNSQLHSPVTVGYTGCNQPLPKQNINKKTKTEQDLTKQPVVVAPLSAAATPVHNEPTIETHQTIQESNDDHYLSAALLALGLGKSVVQHLMQQYSAAYIEEKLAYLSYLQTTQPQKVLKPCGWLRKAIENDYAAPDGYATPQAQASESIDLQQLEEVLDQEYEAQQRRKDEERTRQEQEIAAQRMAIRATYGTTERELKLWQQLLDEFKLTLPAAIFTRYFAETWLLSVKDGEALIGLPDKYGSDWLDNRFGKKLALALSAQLDGQPYRVKFIDLSLLINN